MKKIYLILFLLPLITKSQSKKPETDSSYYYQGEMGKLMRTAMDSVKKSPEYVELLYKYNHYVSKSKDYTAFTIFTEYAHADYGAFNKSIGASRFSPLSDIFPRIGFGISSKSGHAMFNMAFAIFGINSKTEHNGEKIKTASNDLFYFDFGYDVLNSGKFSLYPYGGFSLRSSTLRYTKDAQVNPNYTNVSDIIIGDQSVSASSTKVGYHAGIAFDVRIGKYHYPVEETHVRSTGSVPIILFVKFGTNMPIGKETFKIQGIKYKPDFRQGDWGITVGVKFP